MEVEEIYAKIITEKWYKVVSGICPHVRGEPAFGREDQGLLQGEGGFRIKP